MPGVTWKSSAVQMPEWAACQLEAENLLPAGTQLNLSQFTPNAQGQVVVPSGTLLGRTYTERAAGTGFGPALETDDEIFIVAFQVERGEIDAGVTFVRHQRLVYENKLPGWDGFDADTKAKVRSLYQCIVSA
ncbi:hypothetical protein [Leptolyngbya ohadii]|uniref:hypothetical protein n=1 Tax=Leptolyngbya ohadii TaxID=1962290 RepID=UPI00117BDBA3|nr:hypothetical protein [Leptolyngbya ohadii]